MIEEDLIKLAFKRVHVNREESSDKDDYYYYYLKKGPVTIITCPNTEAVDHYYKMFIEVEHTAVKDENGLSLKKLISHLNFKYKE